MRRELRREVLDALRALTASDEEFRRRRATSWAWSPREPLGRGARAPGRGGGGAGPQRTKYELRGRVGRGGMGTVWRAYDRELGREVALKVMNGPDPRPGGEARLRTEAQVLARLEHPGLVPVHDLGALPDGRMFYAMKLVRGRRLDEHARDLRSPAPACASSSGSARRSPSAHAHGVIHRDLKPQNVMVGPVRRGAGPRLGRGQGARGAGAARGGPASRRRPPCKVDADAATLTAAGTVLGTPGYMAPEQARGESAIGVAAGRVRAGARSSRSWPATRLRAPWPPWSRARAHPGPRTAIPPSTPCGRTSPASSPTSLSARTPRDPLEQVRRLATKHRTPLVLVLAYLVMRALLAFVARV
jgi:serine/threonine protein kinase